MIAKKQLEEWREMVEFGLDDDMLAETDIAMTLLLGAVDKLTEALEHVCATENVEVGLRALRKVYAPESEEKE